MNAPEEYKFISFRLPLSKGKVEKKKLKEILSELKVEVQSTIPNLNSISDEPSFVSDVFSIKLKTAVSKQEASLLVDTVTDQLFTTES